MLNRKMNIPNFPDPSSALLALDPSGFYAAGFAGSRFASQKGHDAFCFCLYRAVKSGRELVCAKKNLKLISRGIVQSLIATPRGRRTYPEKKSNRWRITRRCAVPQAKPAVSREPGSTLLSPYIQGRRAEEPTTVNDYLLITREAQRCASRSVKDTPNPLPSSHPTHAVWIGPIFC